MFLYGTGRVRYLTPDQEAKLLAALPAELVPIVWTAVLSGMRRSEVMDRVRRIPIHPELRPVLEAPGAAQDPRATWSRTRRSRPRASV